MGYLLKLQGTPVRSAGSPDSNVEPERSDTSTWSYFFCRDYSHYSVWVGCGGGASD